MIMIKQKKMRAKGGEKSVESYFDLRNNSSKKVKEKKKS